MLRINEIHRSFDQIGLSENDVVMIHGDAGVAAQIDCDPASDKLFLLIREIINYFKKGTIIFPTFTYSATKNEVFCPVKTKSEVGLFSEKFLKFNGVVRSNHPIFSVGCYGKRKNYFAKTKNFDCFGQDSLFDKLYLSDAKILTLGCGFDSVTFTHYVEQKINVPYRYFKNFDGKIKLKGKIINQNIRYYVRDLNLSNEINFDKLEKSLSIKKKLRKGVFGRFSLRSVSAKNFNDVLFMLLKKDYKSLLKKYE